jgi:hypothetical protein
MAVLVMATAAGDAGVEQRLMSVIHARDLEILRLREELGLLRERMARIEPRHRPRYAPEARFKIVVHKATWSLAFDETAELPGQHANHQALV